MMKKILGAVAAAALITTVFAGCSTGEVGGTTSSKADGSSETKLTGTLTMAGSTSMTDVCTALNEAFMKKNSGVKVVLNGGGSGAAITALGDGSAQVGNLSRAVKDSENADGTYEAITIGRESGSGTRDGFEDIVKVKDACQYDVTLNSTGAVVSKVMSDANAIGYVSYSAVSDEIKALKVGGVEINDDNIADKSYALQRPFVHAYLKNTDNELVQAYLQFLQTDEAQNIMKKDKLIPQEFWK